MSHIDEDVLTQHAAGALDETARLAVVAHLQGCEHCQKLFEDVSSLVNSNTLQAPISSVPPAKPTDTRPDSPAAHEDQLYTLQKGTPLGRYVLLERLGVGGMGEVFAAYDPHLDRKVALKLLRTGTVSADEGRARLLREAQAMARLQHPNVVIVHDVGTLGDRVFVAMEFIEGETAGQWMRTTRPWFETLRVFLSVGSGLSAAHRAGIVHRDFKPDNIIIGKDGRARVLDFGLARAATSSEVKKEAPQSPADSPLGAPLTRDGAVMGTPGYMAPEQLGGLPTDARSDQFSFCVALFEALYGKRPFGGATLKAHATEMVMNQLPPPPAAHEAPASVWNALRRGLQAEPKERYPDMEALLSALEPRRAGARRTRMLVALVALGAVAALGVGFSVWSTQRLRVCSGAEARLTGVWDSAAKERLKKAFAATRAPYATDAFKGVESALDAYAQSWVSAEKDSCEAVRIRKTDSEELYQKKTFCLETRLKALRATLALLQTADQVVVSNAVSAARGLVRIDDCRDAVALSQLGALSSGADPVRDEALRSRLIEAKALLDAGKYARGVEVAKLAALGGGSTALLAEAYLLLGRLQMRAGDPKAAEAAYFEAAAHAEQSGDAVFTARAFSRLFQVTGAIQERFDVAHAWERLANAAAARVGNDPDVEAELASNSGDVALSEERLTDAKNNFERALTIRKGYLPENHPDVAMSYSNLGTAYAKLRQFDEAERQYQKSYELHLQNEGPDHPNTASSMNNLAVVYRQQGRLSDALDFLQRALKVRETNLGPDHLEVASTRIVLANILERMGDAEAALKLFQSALRTREKALGPEHLQVASVHGEIADLYFSQRAFKEALPEAQLALSLVEKSLGHGHATTSNARERVGAIYARLGQWRDAGLQLKAAYEARREKAGPESIEVARSLNSLGELEFEQHRFDKALQYFEQALALREGAAGVSSPSLANDLVSIGKCHLGLKAADKAVAPLERAVALREKSEDAENLAAARFQLAKALWEAGPEGHERSKQLAEAARTVLRGPNQGDVEKWLASR